MQHQFTYTDSKKKTTERLAWMVHPASDFNLMLDLSDVPVEDVEHVMDELQELKDAYHDAIEEMGLGKQYRHFKPENMNAL